MEYAGTCINSKANRNVTNPNFSELFIFPVNSDACDPGIESEKQSGVDTTKIFVSLLTVEGKSDIPAGPDELDELRQRRRRDDGTSGAVTAMNPENVYKRVAELCLDIGEIC